MLVQKLKIYAMLMRLQEIEKERLLKIELQEIRRMTSFKPEPIKILPVKDLMPNYVFGYDKKGKLLENTKSKYHK